MAAIELVNISKTFIGENQREVRAVDDVSLSIKNGEFFSLLGSSGCGKTTILRMIAGFELPSEGEILLNGTALRDRPPFHRPINTVFQNYALFPHLTVAQNVGFGLEMEGVMKEELRDRVQDALALVQLNGLEKRRPRQLSGGQQQRVALARALVKQPQVLLFDEPLGALDLKLRKEMQLELKHMQQALGITFIYVTHDQEEALTMSDRIAVLSNGQVQQVGTPTEIYEQPNCRFVADFIGESNFLVGQLIEYEAQNIIVLVDGELPIPVPNHTELPIGKMITLAVRPEKITLHPLDLADSGGWLGKIQEVVYLGMNTRFIVQLTSQSQLIVRQQNVTRTRERQFAVGDQVYLQIELHNFQVVDESAVDVSPSPTSLLR